MSRKAKKANRLLYPPFPEVPLDHAAARLVKRGFLVKLSNVVKRSLIDICKLCNLGLFTCFLGIFGVGSLMLPEVFGL